MQRIKDRIKEWIQTGIKTDESIEINNTLIRVYTSAPRNLCIQVGPNPGSYLWVRISKHLNIKIYNFFWTQDRPQSEYYLECLELFRNQNIMIDLSNTVAELKHLQPERIWIFVNKNTPIKGWLSICKKITLFAIQGSDPLRLDYADLYNYEIILYTDLPPECAEEVAIRLNQTNKLIVYVREYDTRICSTYLSIYYLALKNCKCHIELYSIRNNTIINETHQLERYYKTTGEYNDKQNLRHLHELAKRSKNLRHPLADPSICKLILAFLHW